MTDEDLEGQAPPPATRSSIPMPEPGPDERHYHGSSAPRPKPDIIPTENAPEWITPAYTAPDGGAMSANEARAHQAELDANAED